MVRFTISLDDRLARQFDAWCAARKYENRSEAVRDLFRSEIDRGKQRASRAGHCVACLSYVYNHHERDLAEKLTHLQHQHHELTMSTMHAHLDHEHCLESVFLRGRVATVEEFANLVIAERGVHHGSLNMISVDLHEPHSKRPARRGKSASSGRSQAHVHVHVKPSS